MIVMRTFNLLCLVCILFQVNAQRDSTHVHNKKEIRAAGAIIPPALLMSMGMIATTDIDVGDEEIYEARIKRFPNFHTNVDDYLLAAPIAAVLSLNAFGVQAKNNFRPQMWLLVKAEFIMAALVFPLKAFTNVTRPDYEKGTSFPSGHTAHAFAAATFIHLEYGKQNWLYSAAAYGMAATIAVLRVMNNRHWASDVLFGAGIGILSTNIVYLHHEKRKSRNLKVIPLPVFQSGSIGVGAIIPLK